MTDYRTGAGSRKRSEHGRTDADDLLRRGFEQLPTGVGIACAAGGFLFVNGALCELLGRSESALLERDFLSVLHPSELADIDAVMAELSAGERDVWRGEVRIVRGDGETVWVDSSASSLLNQAGAVDGYIFQAQDISDRRRARAQLERRVAEQAAVAELGSLALSGAGICELMTEACKVAQAHLGCEYVGITELLPGGDQMLLRAAAGPGMRKQHIGSLRLPVADTQTAYALRQRAPVVVEELGEETRFSSTLAAQNGIRSGVCAPIDQIGALWAQTTIGRAFDGQDIGFVQSVANVVGQAIQRQRVEERARHSDLHDPLTGLANRALFRDRVQHALAQSARRASNTAVLFLDLDNFKGINDSAGHSRGDELLAAVAERLHIGLRDADTLARFGGDTFAVLCEEIAGIDDAVALAERLSAALAPPFTLSDGAYAVSASIGIALADGQRTNTETLLQNADAALYRAKERGRSRYELFDERRQEQAMRRVGVERALRHAIDDGLLAIAYQPLIGLPDGRIKSAEALLRFTHPELGPVSPAEFIPIAEQTGLIHPLGGWVLQQACEQAARWLAEPELRRVDMAINVSAHQLAQPDFPNTVRLALERARLGARHLTLELTETALISAGESPLVALESLKEIGVRVVLDDFGTGYSSLSYLERFPLDGLKLDRSFVAGIERNPRARAIFAAVVNMATALELPVVAEGVETEHHAAIVSHLGCTLAQGYHYAAPMPAQEFSQLLAESVSTNGFPPA